MARTNRWNRTRRRIRKGTRRSRTFASSSRPSPNRAQASFSACPLSLGRIPICGALLSEAAGSGYMSAVKPGDPMPGGAVGVIRGVETSRVSQGRCRGGMLVGANGPRRTAKTFARSTVARPRLDGSRRARNAGMTAYFGLLDIAPPKTGETVSFRALRGRRRARRSDREDQEMPRGGIAGSDEKVRHIVEDLGSDARVQLQDGRRLRRKAEGTLPAGDRRLLRQRRRARSPTAVFPLINVGARISVCGQILAIQSRTHANGRPAISCGPPT